MPCTSGPWTTVYCGLWTGGEPWTTCTGTGGGNNTMHRPQLKADQIHNTHVITWTWRTNAARPNSPKSNIRFINTDYGGNALKTITTNSELNNNSNTANTQGSYNSYNYLANTANYWITVNTEQSLRKYDASIHYTAGRAAGLRFVVMSISWSVPSVVITLFTSCTRRLI